MCVEINVYLYNCTSAPFSNNSICVYDLALVGLLKPLAQSNKTAFLQRR